MVNYVTFLRGAVIGGLCAIPFISFIIAGTYGVPNMFFPYITGKNFVFRILVEILLLAYIILALKEPKYRPKGSYLLWTAGAFVLWMGIATIFSIDPVKSFWSNFERMDGYVTVIHLFALFVIAGAVLTAEKWWINLFRISVVIASIQGIHALFQILNLFGLSPSSQSGARADTTFGNATYLAVFMLFNIFLTIFMMVRDRKSLTARTLYAIALLLQVPALYFTETRGAMLGVLGGLLVTAVYVALFARQSEWQLARRFAWGGLAAIALLVGTFFLAKDTSFVRESPGLGRLASISLNDPTTRSRLFYIWPMAVEGALEKPITGWGQENFSYIFNEHYNPAMYNQEQWFDRAHNEFLDWFVAGGAPAALLYLALFVLAAWAIARSELSVPEQGILWGLLAAYAFNNLFVFDNLMSIVYFFLILAFLHGLSCRPLPRRMLWLKPASDHTVAIAAPIVAIVILGGGWMLNAQGFARAQTVLQALQPATIQDSAPEKKLDLFKAALAGGGLGQQEVTEQLIQFASSIAASQSVRPETKEATYAASRAAAEAMLAEREGDARVELFLGMLLLQFGKYDDALKHLSKAAELSPNKQQILFQQGQTYAQKGDLQNALGIFKKAFDLAPDFDQARMYYAGALYYAGQNSQADALLTEKFGTVEVDDDQLVQIYSNTRQYGRVIAIWEARVAKDPKNVDVHLGLASAYFAAGWVTDTIAELENVAQLNPAVAAEVQSYISQIKSGALRPGQ